MKNTLKNVYVEVDSKEQAETYRKVLEAMGQPIDDDFNYEIRKSDNFLCIHNYYWNVLCNKGDDDNFINKISFGELVDLLNRKPLLVSEDGVDLYEDSELHIVWKDGYSWVYDTMHVGFKSNDGGWYVNPKLKKTDRKIFSTKQAALEWIEAQNPKETEFEFTEHGSVLVIKDKVVFNGLVKELTRHQFILVASEFERLNNG